MKSFPRKSYSSLSETEEVKIPEDIRGRKKNAAKTMTNFPRKYLRRATETNKNAIAPSSRFKRIERAILF